MTESSRLEFIETKLAHLESSLQQLGQAVMRQQREIEVLAERNRALKEQLEMVEGGGASAAGFEKPPHY
ncbi:MAG: SlyX family protein [Steroidobacteraceae bacterium]|jgi:uncharacterized coiled-coil protein SlyX